jgi:hypothetical protein
MGITVRGMKDVKSVYQIIIENQPHAKHSQEMTLCVTVLKQSFSYYETCSLPATEKAP